MHHVFAFAITPDGGVPPSPRQPMRSDGPKRDDRDPDHRVLIASLAIGATTFALLGLVATVTVP